MDKLELHSAGTSLSLVSIVTFLGFLDTHLLVPVLAIYAAGLGASTSIIGLIVGVYSLTNTAANIVSGWLIDRVGYRFPLLLGLAGDALSMFLYALCRLPWHLALVRAFHGLSGGAVGPATMSAASHYSGRSDKARTMSFYGVSLALASLIGYPVSGVIVSRLGYQALFLTGAGLLVIGVLLGLMLPAKANNGSKAVKTGYQWQSGRVKELFKKRGLVIAYCSIFAQYFSFGGLVTLLPLYMQGLGMGVFQVGMLLAIFSITFIMVQFPGGVMSDRVGRLPPVILGLSMAILSLLALPFLEVFALLAVGMGLYGVAYGFIFPSISAMVADDTEREERGLATGMFHALLTAGVAAGAPLLGWVGGAVGIEYGLLSIAGIMVLALAVILAIRRR